MNWAKTFFWMTVLTIVLVLIVPRVRARLAAHRDPNRAKRGRIHRWASQGIDILADGVLDAIWLIRDRPLGVLGGAKK